MAGWLEGKTALITGAANGIGRAVATRYLEEGARGIVAIDRDAEGLERLRDDLGPKVEILSGDVRDYALVESGVARAVARFGALDVAVGNAGIFDFNRPLRSYTPESLSATVDEIFAVNVKSYLLLALAARPALIEARGSLVFTASVAGFHPGAAGIVYVMAKHAIVGLIRRLALEFAPSVRVNGVGPGGTLTQLRGSEALGHAERSILEQPHLAAELIGKSVPLGFAQNPEDHTGLYVLLASARNSRAITGEIMMSDGGVGVRRI